MKGWQYRWFVLDYNAGLLSYYTVRSTPGFLIAETGLLSRFKLARVVKPEWETGLVFVRSWESELA